MKEYQDNNPKINSDNVMLSKDRLDNLPYDFIEDLKKKHPNLTKSEIKFCTYIKMRLPIDEIISILNISNEGIKKKKYRLRKKIILEKNDSLEFYISKF